MYTWYRREAVDPRPYLDRVKRVKEIGSARNDEKEGEIRERGRRGRWVERVQRGKGMGRKRRDI